MSKDLVFPKTDNGQQENPVIAAARKSLQLRKPKTEAKPEKTKSAVAKCWRCKDPVGKAGLTQKWIRELNAQRWLCENCVPLKDEPYEGETYEADTRAVIPMKKVKYPVAKVEPSGRKDDSEKLQMNLLPWDALEEVAKVLTAGAKKYSPNGWKTVPDKVERYEAALIRHLAAYKRGEDLDPEDGLSHLAHLACNALFLVSFREEKR
jgi:hypothetical protein